MKEYPTTGNELPQHFNHKQEELENLRKRKRNKEKDPEVKKRKYSAPSPSPPPSSHRSLSTRYHSIKNFTTSKETKKLLQQVKRQTKDGILIEGAYQYDLVDLFVGFEEKREDLAKNTQGLNNAGLSSVRSLVGIDDQVFLNLFKFIFLFSNLFDIDSSHGLSSKRLLYQSFVLD